ncbi:unnamed protein product [Spirodela intermedia]|uniref:Uncharacterized protein n=2 Tax=Spirodela intermedia TaxID=51605 RepID=A0A7I8IMP9_SPIIN|nr:unnamed protein product [Spirodela intermedia]CAA6659069.1 unnamed protein product [Spirodela intermedia]CAA7395358.1 unnamed protein product [Spirodela intermedia]
MHAEGREGGARRERIYGGRRS